MAVPRVDAAASARARGSCPASTSTCSTATNPPRAPGDDIIIHTGFGLLRGHPTAGSATGPPGESGHSAGTVVGESEREGECVLAVDSERSSGLRPALTSVAAARRHDRSAARPPVPGDLPRLADAHDGTVPFPPGEDVFWNADGRSPDWLYAGREALLRVCIHRAGRALEVPASGWRRSCELLRGAWWMMLLKMTRYEKVMDEVVEEKEEKLSNVARSFVLA